MTVVRYFIAAAVLLATLAYCEWLATMIPATHVVYAFCVAFTLLGAATLVNGIVGHSVFPDSYFAPQPFEREGQIYRRTGNLLLVACFRLTGYERFWRKKIPVRYGLEALRLYCESTRGTEVLHVVAGFCMAVLTVRVGLRHSMLDTAWLWLMNVLVNFYPILLQRYNRPRVERIIQRLERSSGIS